MNEPVLKIENLSVDYVSGETLVRAVDRVSLDVKPGEIVGLAGESGCGKTTLAKAILRILPPPAIITGGKIEYGGKDILEINEGELRNLRWQKISIVFQSAMNALNPVIRVGEQITDVILAHKSVSPDEAYDRARQLLEMVGIHPIHINSYSHQLSGGMRQRVCIALALALEPEIVIMDEPTTALDVIVEREILNQIKDLQARLGFSVIYITHDLAHLLQFSHRLAILYAAHIAEIAPTQELRENPLHPYTQKLMRAMPSLAQSEVKPETIPGTPPSLANPPPGCRFHPRCDRAIEICRREKPPLVEKATNHLVACHLVS